MTIEPKTRAIVPADDATGELAGAAIIKPSCKGRFCFSISDEDFHDGDMIEVFNLRALPAFRQLPADLLAPEAVEVLFPVRWASGLVRYDGEYAFVRESRDCRLRVRLEEIADARLLVRPA